MLLSYLKSTGIFVSRLYVYRSMIIAMALREIKSRYAGTTFGLVWSLAQPLAMMVIYWFVFSVGLKIQTEAGMPFVIVFLAALIPWTMFSEALTASTNAISGNPHLVKKTVFPTEILPMVNLVVGLVSHTIMLFILVVLLALYGIPFTAHFFQFLYYLAALCVLTLGLSWVCSALNVFFRDTGHILQVVLNMWFWLTPIVWSVQLIPPQYRIIVKLNPMFYIVEGYKASLVYHGPMWQDYGTGIYFWGVSLIVCLSAVSVFRRLKPEFAEVL